MCVFCVCCCCWSLDFFFCSQAHRPDFFLSKGNSIQIPWSKKYSNLESFRNSLKPRKSLAICQSLNTKSSLVNFLVSGRNLVGTECKILFKWFNVLLPVFPHKKKWIAKKKIQVLQIKNTFIYVNVWTILKTENIIAMLFYVSTALQKPKSVMNYHIVKHCVYTSLLSSALTT